MSSPPRKKRSPPVDCPAYPELLTRSLDILNHKPSPTPPQPIATNAQGLGWTRTHRDCAFLWPHRLRPYADIAGFHQLQSPTLRAEHGSSPLPATSCLHPRTTVKASLAFSSPTMVRPTNTPLLLHRRQQPNRLPRPVPRRRRERTLLAHSTWAVAAMLRQEANYQLEPSLVLLNLLR